MNKQKLFIDIMDWYEYNMRFDGERIVIDNGISDYELEFVGVNDCGHIEYNNVDEALRDWLTTLKETNKTFTQEQVGKYWKQEIIDFITLL